VGGKQSKLQLNNPLETFNPILNVGNNQKFQFKDSDNGSYYLNLIQYELQKSDVIKGKKNVT